MRKAKSHLRLTCGHLRVLRGPRRAEKVKLEVMLVALLGAPISIQPLTSLPEPFAQVRGNC